MKRASNGESTIHQAQDGRWHGYVWMGTKEGGVPDRRHVTGRTRAVVAQKVRELEKRRDAGTAAEAGRAPTLGEWMDHWLTNIAARRVRPLTLHGYDSTVRMHIRPGIGHHRLDRLLPEHLEAFYLAMEARGLAPATVLRMHRMLHRALKVAHQRGKVGRNVAALVDAPTVKRPNLPRALDVDECRAVLTAAKEVRNSARWTVALSLGLRQSEALGLMWDDIDLDKGTLAVNRGLHRVPGGGLVYEEPKTAKSRRVIFVPAQLLSELRAHRTVQDLERAESEAAGLWVEHGLVFPNELGGPMDDRNDYRSWVSLLRRAKVRRVRLHDGRHTAATLLLASGVHPRVVMELLGHSAMSTTTDIYSHVMPALAKEAAETMNAALWGASEPPKKAKKGSKTTKPGKGRGPSSGATPETATKTATRDDEGL